jgi:hypothetical protein
MSKKRKRGVKLVNRLNAEVPRPDQVEQMFNDVENIEDNISRKAERKKFGTQLRPDLIKALKRKALDRDITITELLESILEEYLSDK